MNKLIILDNKYARFMTEDTTLINSLRNQFSYKTPGVEYTAAYQNGWSGKNYLVSKKGVFLSGLLFKIREFLNERKIVFSEEDKRIISPKEKEIDLTEKLKQLSLVPRDHQVRIIEACLQNNKGIVRSCTGSGKTSSIGVLTAKLNKPTTIYVIGLDLLKQFHDLFSALFDEPIGYIGDGICDIQRINIASIWTIGRSLKIKEITIDDDEMSEEKFNENNSQKIINMLKISKVHIFDESHVVATKTIENILDIINPEHIYGFSGTPFRDDNTDLLINGILGEQIINVSASELIRKGLLAQPIIQFIPVPKMSGLSSANYQTVYKDYVVENETRNDLIIKHTINLIKKGYTPLVLFKQIKHGNMLLEKFKNANIKCEMLYGNDTIERRFKVKQMLIDKEIDIILASTIFDIGIDLPQLSALILCGSGKSSVKILQRCGRVIRNHPGKTIAAIVDFYDQVKFLKQHSKIRDNVYNSEDGFRVIKCKEMG